MQVKKLMATKKTDREFYNKLVLTMIESECQTDNLDKIDFTNIDLSLKRFLESHYDVYPYIMKYLDKSISVKEYENGKELMNTLVKILDVLKKNHNINSSSDNWGDTYDKIDNILYEFGKALGEECDVV